MSFVQSELIVESVLREGFTAIRRDLTLIDDLFEDLKTQGYLAKKYGEREVNKIKDFFSKSDIGIVHAFHQVPSSVPCVSIQLLDNPEDTARAHLDDFENDLREPLDTEELASEVVVPNMTVISYNALTGLVNVHPSTDLSAVQVGHLFVDSPGKEFKILTGISNVAGLKRFFIDKNLSPDISSLCMIKTSIKESQTEIRGIVETERVILGVHTKEALLTKYLYQVVKYILNSRKKDLILRGFQNATYSGSDFTRNLEYPGDQVFNRFLTLTGMVQQSWRADKVVPIDIVDIIVKVDKDVATTAQAGRTDQTVQIKDE